MRATPERLSELDWLRALACAMVVAYHYLYQGPNMHWTGGVTFLSIEPITQYGFFGVYLFFMISGFVIFMSVQNRTPGQFAVDRFWRLYPTFWVAIAVTTVFVITFKATAFIVSPKDWLANFTMFPEVLKAASVDGAYWSLQIELVFYLYIAVSLVTGLIRKPLLLLSLALVLSSLNLVLKSVFLEVFFLAKCWPFFAIGILCYLVRNKLANKKICWVLLAANIATCGFIFAFGQHKKAYAPIEGVIIIVLACLFCWLMAKPRRFRSNALGRFAGNMTYPVFLIHQNIGYILITLLAGTLGSNLAIGAALLIVLALSLVIHQVVEKTAVPKLRRLITHSSRG